MAQSLTTDVDTAGRLLSLAAATHDLGKANPYFQYQERAGHSADEFASELATLLGLPRSPDTVRAQLNAHFSHPLRRHEFITHRVVTGAWPDSSQPILGARWLGTLVAGHHGYWRDPAANGTWIGHPGATGDQLIAGWSEQQQALLARIEDAMGASTADLFRVEGSVLAFVLHSGLLTLADWISSEDARVESGKKLWNDVAGGPDDPYTSGEGARRWMQLRTDELESHAGSALGPFEPVARDRFESAVLGEYEPRPLQAEAKGFTPESEPGLWIAMYPTGDGKTEAALLRGAVRPDEGLFFGLPTLATTDAMEARLASLGSGLGGAAFPLMKSHQFAAMMRPADEPMARRLSEDEQCDHTNTSWYTASIRKLVAPNVVGTVDQALIGALAQRHVTLRLFGLANHHIVLDEVHTYDPYQTELLLELLYWWGVTRTRVTLLSATLPSAHMRSMVRAYRAGVLGAKPEEPAEDVDSLNAVFPSTVSVTATDDGHVSVTTRVPGGGVRQPQPTAMMVTEVDSRSARVSAHIDWVRRISTDHPSSPIAVVSNVVADCTAIARALADDPVVNATHDVLCLHSGLVAGHRAATEQALIRRAGRAAHHTGFGTDSGRPVVIVGTQVIQASLDYDVDFMSTDLAPAPDLIQRLGRVWRFEGAFDGFRGGRLREGTDRALHIVTVVDDDSAPSRAGSVPYLTAVLRRTHAELVSEVARTRVVDVYGFSQRWVDASYDQDPFALLADLAAEQNAALDETLAISSRTTAAFMSRAALGRPNLDGGAALLPSPTRRRPGPVWADLVQLTQRPDDEALMRTRYIEQESMAVIVIDSGTGATYFDPNTESSVPFPDTSIDDLLSMATPAALPRIAQWRLAVPAALCSDVEVAVAATLGGREWKPRSKTLESTPPLDLRCLADVLGYHPRTGLTKEHE